MRYDKFTDRARRVMSLANRESRSWDHEYIGTEHILLALIEEGLGVAGMVLKDLGLTDALVQTVSRTMSRGAPIVTLGHLVLTPKATQAIDKARDWASKLKHQYVGTEHLLLGLIGIPDALPAVAISTLGVTPADIERRCLEFLGHAEFDATKPTVFGGPIPLMAISPILFHVMQGHWVRLHDGKIESRENVSEDISAN